ncbi:hypothetical protein Vretifemale_3786 [Volvox reticuliferus]|nr:hypothetical protein Vretifemale_3786 [Volvox reticuliferus]
MAWMLVWSWMVELAVCYISILETWIGPGVKRHGTPLTCNAVSKKGPLPGGDSTGKSMATLAKSLLRDAMAGRYCKASASSSVIRSPYASVNILKRYVRVRVHALPSTIKAALHVQINNRGRRCGAALPIPGPLPCRWLGLPSAISSLAATGSTGMGSSGSRTAAVAALPEDLRSATYAITATNTAIFFLSALVPLLPASALLLNHRQPQLLQLLTSSFAHPSLESLMLCVFFTYIFGRVVERSHGSLATWVVYATCGTAAAALAWCLLPAKAALLSSSAPAAAWGLFLVGIGLPRLTKKPLEVACLLPFTFAATISRYSPLAGLMVYEGMSQGQLIHVAGASMAAMVAVLVLGAVEALRAEAERKRQVAKRQEAAAREEEAINAVINAASQAAAQIGKKLL